MAKNDVYSWSTTPAANLDISGIDIAEGCPPAGINDALRTLMAQVRSFLTNPTFSGLLKTGSISLDPMGYAYFGNTTFYLTNQGDPTLNLAANTYVQYNAGQNGINLVVGGVLGVRADPAGAVAPRYRLDGFPLAYFGKSGPNTIVNFAANAGVFFDEANVLFVFFSNGQNVATLDAGGNLRVRGAVIPNASI